MSEPFVSVVLPVFNEVTHLTQEIDRIRAALDVSEYTYEILVVDDGSTDGSSELLQTIDGIRVIRFSTNRGSGTARRIGTEAARGEIVVWTDVDMTYPNADIPQLVKELEGYDQVVGARTSEEGTAKFLRVPVKWFIRRLAAYLSATAIPDLNSGYRAFRRNVAMQFVDMLPKGFSCVTTMTMTFLANGYSVKYVPISYLERAGQSKFHWLRDTQQYVIQIVRLVMSYDPLRVFIPIAMALTVLAFGKLTFDLIVHPLRVATNTLLIFFAAFQTFAIGLIADLVVRMQRRGHDVPPASF